MKAKLLTILGIIVFSMSFSACTEEEFMTKKEVQATIPDSDVTQNTRGEVDFGDQKWE